MWKEIRSAFSLWNVVRGASSPDIERQFSLPITLTIIADEENYELLRARLGSPLSPIRVEPGDRIPDSEGQILFDGLKLVSCSDREFDVSLGHIAIRHADRRIALAAAAPAFRTVVANQISHEWAYKNAKFSAMTALPGIIPFTDFLLPITAIGDFYMLTKNQTTLLLEVAACYGHATEPKTRLKELLPVVGGAFGWRAIARELVGLVPGGLGVAIKAFIAYAGTYAVGRASSFYFAGGRKTTSQLRLGEIFRDAVAEAIARVRSRHFGN